MTAHQLRRRNWFGHHDFDRFVHRSRFSPSPVVGIERLPFEFEPLHRRGAPLGRPIHVALSGHR